MNREIMANSLPTSPKGVRFIFAEFIHQDYFFGYIGTLVYSESGIQHIYIIDN